MSCFATVLLRSSVALVEAQFSYIGQGGGVSCIVKVLVNLEVKTEIF